MIKIVWYTYLAAALTFLGMVWWMELPIWMGLLSVLICTPIIYVISNAAQNFVDLLNQRSHP